MTTLCGFLCGLAEALAAATTRMVMSVENCMMDVVFRMEIKTM